MERNLFLLLSIIILKLFAANIVEDELCFPVIGDFGGLPRPPYQTSSQKKVANLMAKVTEKLKCQFVLGLGDNFYFDGVKDVADPRFYLTFERTYSHPSLNIPWYIIAGNHDHVQNVTAQILYSKVSTRWKFPNFFHSVIHKIPNSKKTVEILMLDTTMLCWHNRKSSSPPPHVQWKWLEEKLKQSRANYLLVAGHHPVLSAGSHGNTHCLTNQLKPLLEKYDVTAYFSGHDHNLQHIKEEKSSVHYFISGSGNFVDPRMTNKNKLSPNSLKFAHGLFGGFLLVRLNEIFMEMVITNSEPKKLYRLKIKPRNKETINLNVEKYSGAKLKTLMPLLHETIMVARPNPVLAVSSLALKPFPLMDANIDEQLKQKVYWSTWFLDSPHKQSKDEG